MQAKRNLSLFHPMQKFVDLIDPLVEFFSLRKYENCSYSRISVMENRITRSDEIQGSGWHCDVCHLPVSAE